MPGFIPKISMSVFATILLTGAVLNFMANSGNATAQKIAQYVTKGYGQ